MVAPHKATKVGGIGHVCSVTNDTIFSKELEEVDEWQSRELSPSHIPCFKAAGTRGYEH